MLIFKVLDGRLGDRVVKSCCKVMCLKSILDFLEKVINTRFGGARNNEIGHSQLCASRAQLMYPSKCSFSLAASCPRYVSESTL